MNGLITDLYQLTMANALFNKGRHERKVVFDRFYRKNPFNGGYTIVAGLEHLQQFVENFRFDEEDINYLESLHIFYPAFLDYLKDNDSGTAVRMYNRLKHLKPHCSADISEQITPYEN